MFPLLIQEHDRKQAHAVYPSELSIFKTGCWFSTFFCLFFLSVLYKIFKYPSASSLGVLESYFFVFLTVFFLLNSSSTGRTQFCCYAFFWLIKQPHVAHAQIQPAFWLPSNKLHYPMDTDDYHSSVPSNCHSCLAGTLAVTGTDS